MSDNLIESNNSSSNSGGSNSGNSGKHLRAVVESSLLIALASVLSLITVFHMPQGGSVTLLSMLPILIIGVRHGLGFGLLAGFVYGALQIVLGGIALHLGSYLMDYILAFGILGLSGLFTHSRHGLAKSVLLCIPLRFILHTASGVLFFASYAPEGTPALIYSILYNGSYMLPEGILTLIGAWLLQKYLPRYVARP